MHSRKVNKTRYDDPGKPMKQTSFTIKKPEGNLLKKKFTIINRSFRSSTKPLSLSSTIPTDELTVETFYRFRTFELFSIDRKSTRLNSSHNQRSRMPSSA